MDRESSDVLKQLQKTKARNRSEFADRRAQEQLTKKAMPPDYTYVGRDADDGKTVVSANGELHKTESKTNGLVQPNQGVQVRGNSADAIPRAKTETRIQLPTARRVSGKIATLYQVEKPNHDREIWVAGFQAQPILVRTLKGQGDGFSERLRTGAGEHSATIDYYGNGNWLVTLHVRRVYANSTEYWIETISSGGETWKIRNLAGSRLELMGNGFGHLTSHQRNGELVPSADYTIEGDDINGVPDRANPRETLFIYYGKQKVAPISAYSTGLDESLYRDRNDTYYLLPRDKTFSNPLTVVNRINSYFVDAFAVPTVGFSDSLSRQMVKISPSGRSGFGIEFEDSTEKGILNRLGWFWVLSSGEILSGSQANGWFSNVGATVPFDFVHNTTVDDKGQCWTVDYRFSLRTLQHDGKSQDKATVTRWNKEFQEQKTEEVLFYTFKKFERTIDVDFLGSSYSPG